jgi:2-dehydropantoate 2-reductase
MQASLFYKVFNMRITIMGAGAVGAYFGGRLAQAGEDVRFIARGAHLAALQADGLRLASPLGDLHLPHVQASADPTEFGPCDIVIFGVKLWDTEAAARQLLPVMTPQTAVISMQNGVVKDDLLAGVLGAAAVVPGVAYISATIEAPGTIRQVGNMAKLAFGESDGSISDRLQQMAQACTAAGVDHGLSRDIRRVVWEKFVFLSSFSAATAAARLPIGPLRTDPASRAVLLALLEEATAVARAEGVVLPSDFAAGRLAVMDTLPEGMRASMAHDLERGHRLEVPWLSADVAARGKRLGVATPTHAALAGVLAPHAGGLARAG